LPLGRRYFGSFFLDPDGTLPGQVPASIEAGERGASTRADISVYRTAVLGRAAVEAQEKRAVLLYPLPGQIATESPIWIKGNRKLTVVARAAPAEVQSPWAIYVSFSSVVTWFALQVMTARELVPELSFAS
jgi:hypothetical protein